MKKIAVDLRCLESPTGRRGMGYYTRSLFQNLLAHPHPDFCFDLITFPGSKLPKKFNVGSCDNFTNIPAMYWPKRGLRRLDPFFALIWSKFLQKSRPDLLHITSLFEIYYLDVPDHIPSVVTLYDIIPLLFPRKYFRNAKAKQWYLKRLKGVKKAAKIITISNSSKNDLIKALNIPPEKIEVIYGGVDGRFKPASKDSINSVLKKYEIFDKYFVTISAHSFHKNTEALFKLMKSFNYKLVVICNLISQEEKDWKKQIQKLGIENKVILTNFVNENDLPALLSGAEIFLFPSYYEGLGLPVLEAFACGTPVICSHTSSLPEIAGNAAIFINPNNSASLKKAILKLLNNAKLRHEQVKRGFVQVKKFSWRKAAQQTLKIYQDVLSSA